MNPTPILTVGIPTYNRADAVADRVRELLQLREALDFRILVIDNASSDGTARKLATEFSHADVEIQRNDENLGFAGNLLRLIEATQTNYITFVSDEDAVERDGLAALFAMLNGSQPRVVSPRAQVADNDCYRGRRVTRSIQPEEFQLASYYLSGLTFETASAKRYAETVAGSLPGNAAAHFYPQVLLTALAVLDGKALFLDSLVTRQVVELQTHLSNYGRGAYWFVPGRWAQFEGFEEFFDQMTERLPHKAADVESMRVATRANIFGLLESAAIAQYPDLTMLRPRARESLAGRISRVVRGR